MKSIKLQTLAPSCHRNRVERSVSCHNFPHVRFLRDCDECVRPIRMYVCVSVCVCVCNRAVTVKSINKLQTLAPSCHRSRVERSVSCHNFPTRRVSQRLR